MQQESETTGPMGLDKKSTTTLSDWIGDMVALESHIEEALDRQLAQVKDDPMVLREVQRFHDLVKQQRDAVKTLRDQYGGTAGSPIKQVGSALLGKAAGVIDMIRTEGISKSIRDDYAAFNLAAIGYSMLHVTALALGDTRVASVAEAHLRGYAQAVQRINHIIPDIVVAELAKDHHQIQAAAADQTRTVVDKAWKETARSAATTATVAG